jgi:acetyl-CoA synthetase
MADRMDFGGDFSWFPTPQLIEQSNLTRFMRAHQIGSYDELLSRSTDDIEWFWKAVLDDLQIRFSRPYETLVDLRNGIARPQWCVGGEMNIIDNLLDRYQDTPTDSKIALRSENESGEIRMLTYAQLRAEVNRFSNALRSLGIGAGDAVGVFLPMSVECVTAMLGIIKVGALFLPLFSGYGASAVATRLVDAGAKALVTTDICARRGKTLSIKAVADQAASQVSTLRHVIVVRRATAENRIAGAAEYEWENLLSGQSDQSPTLRTPADEPMMLIYTSGTTGTPKGAVHTHCGFPIKAAQDISHGLDLHADETLFWMTDMGWMMGPWQVFGTLLLGATMLVYDGAPDYPAPDRIWAMVKRHRVTALGVSPSFVRAMMPLGPDPAAQHDLSSLRKFASTGEPWNPTPWRWLFDVVGKSRLPIINYSGGTEISGGIVMGNVVTPQKPCSFAGPLPGMAADVVDEDGRSVRGRVGELVIRRPWIGMTRGFWKDAGDKRYLETYWSRFNNTWVHGDFAAIDSDGQWYILGRSDDTIKIAGKRLGPAEVESILVAHAAVKEAAAVSIPDDVKGQALLCFCVLGPGQQENEALRDELKRLVSPQLGKALAPKDLKFLNDLPKTRNAKVMRRIIRAAYLNEPVGDVSSLENENAVDQIRSAR